MRYLTILTLLSFSSLSLKAEVSDWPFGSMATTANPYATDAAIEVLAQGGHAVDAAIAASLVLGLVEPQSSGIGGGGFLLVFDREKQELIFYDGRETAPASATPDMFMADGNTMPYVRAWQSGRSVGVPGAVAMYKRAHDRHGKIPWEELFRPAIRLAKDGFTVSPRLANLLRRVTSYTRLEENEGSADYFFPGGKPLVAGQLKANPDYAETLTAISRFGPKAFYTGQIASAIVAAARSNPDPGSLSLEDLAKYVVRTRPVICGAFLAHSVCSTSPPSSGAGQIMLGQIYEHLLEQGEDADKTRAFVDAQRLMYADRDEYFADPDYVQVPLASLLQEDYLRHRAAADFAPDEEPQAGDVGLSGTIGKDTTQEASGTTHLSIIDSQGNAVSLSATIESPFGSSRWAAGFLLNNEMTDFAREVDADGPEPVNSIAPEKRPRSSMSPTFVFDEDGELLLVTGSPGGNSIPAYVGKTILGLLDWGLTPQEAVDFPNIIARGKKVRVETGVPGGPDLAEKLRSFGYEVEARDGENSGIHLIFVDGDKLVGAADKRREGTVRAWPER